MEKRVIYVAIALLTRLRRGWIKALPGYFSRSACSVAIEPVISGVKSSWDVEVVIQSGVYPDPVVSGAPLSRVPSILSSIEKSWFRAL